jgi:hypothetical protein
MKGAIRMTTEEEKLTKDNQGLKEFIGSLGFRMIYMTAGEPGFVCSHAKPCVFCGTAPRVVQDAYYPGRWLTQCPNCASRSVSTRNPIQAVKAWNADKLTEETLLTNHKLTAENMDDEGAKNLIEALSKSATEDLLWAEKTGQLDSIIADHARWFIRNRQVIKDIESGARRLREEKDKKKESLEDDLR